MLRTIVLSAIFACAVLSCKADTTYVISKEEAQAAAKELEVIVQKRNEEGFAAFFDMPSLFAIMAEKTRTAKDPDVMKKIREYNIMPTIKVAMKSAEGGSCKLVRNYEKDGRRHLLFRLLCPTGITYMDFHLIKVGNVVKAEDVLGFQTGEELSTTLAGGLNAIDTEDEKIKEQQKQSNIMRALQKRGDNRGVIELFEELPLALQQDKWILMPYVDACLQFSLDDYKAAVAKLVKVNPYAHLRLIGGCTSTGDFEGAFRSIDTVNQLIGGEGDPYLDFYKGYIHIALGQRAEAKTFYERVAAYDLELLDNLAVLLTMYAEDKDIDKGKKLLARFKASKLYSQEGWDLLQKTFPQLFN